MKSIRRTLTKTEQEWALTGRNISLWRQSVIEWSHPPFIMKRICAGNVFVLLHLSSALLPFLTPFSFLPLNKSFVGAENGDNFTLLQSASHSVISVTSKWWCIRKALVRAAWKCFPLKQSLADGIVRGWVEVHERSIITPHFVLICKMIMGGPCPSWTIRWCIVSP